MDKKVIFIGLGLLVVGGAAYFLMSKKGSATTPSSDSQESDESESDTSIPDELGGMGAPSGGSRKVIRKDCRAEAKSQGLKGKAKRQFRRNCKAQGGVDDGAAFAFNGYGWDINNVGF